MTIQNFLEDFNLNGQIVEIYEKDGQNFITVSIKCNLFDVQVNDKSEFHLKDEIVINSKLLIEKIELQKSSFE